ncbi:hypothetical protein JRQ81_012212 [Phrynocephalus forsythii]|uniref:Uncharacterized protein n=1 Tax=Phrynocephalus forsythii TaxID=171643 RepID=A0A9Q0X5J2_9SAUR|nr:hypothetical protein JRQ81_012212 [Phrynocephalus forsythii]
MPDKGSQESNFSKAFDQQLEHLLLGVGGAAVANGSLLTFWARERTMEAGLRDGSSLGLLKAEREKATGEPSLAAPEAEEGRRQEAHLACTEDVRDFWGKAVAGEVTREPRKGLQQHRWESQLQDFLKALDPSRAEGRGPQLAGGEKLSRTEKLDPENPEELEPRWMLPGRLDRSAALCSDPEELPEVLYGNCLEGEAGKFINSQGTYEDLDESGLPPAATALPGAERDDYACRVASTGDLSLRGSGADSKKDPRSRLSF